MENELNEFLLAMMKYNTTIEDNQHTKNLSQYCFQCPIEQDITLVFNTDAPKHIILNIVETINLAKEDDTNIIDSEYELAITFIRDLGYNVIIPNEPTIISF